MNDTKPTKDCLFCKIVDKTFPSRAVLETRDILAFHDINPQAPVHVLIVPKKHFSSLSTVNKEDGAVFTSLLQAAQAVAKKLELDSHGYRAVFNSGADGCQTVYHLHLHILGGKQLGGSMVG